MVSRIRLIWDRRAALFVERASSLAFKFEVGELALKLFHSISNILLNFGVVRFRQFLALPGQVLLDFGFPVVDI